MGLRKGPILPIVQTNGPHNPPVKNREVQLSSAGSDSCRGGGSALIARLARHRDERSLPELIESFAENPAAAFHLINSL